LGRVVERRRAERRLQQSEEQLLEAQQIAHLGNWQWDIASNRVSWSDELYRIFGLEPQSIDITFEGFLRRVHREDRERVADIIAEAYQTGQPFSFEHQLIRPDGTIRTVQAQGKVLLDATGGPLKMVGIGHDITTQKEIEEQLRHLNTQLEQRVSERTAQLERINQKLAAQIEERRRAEEAKRQLYEAEQLARRVAEETAERIATLQEITAAFSEALTSAQVAKVVVEQGFPMLGGEAGMIVLYNKEEASLTTLETIGYSANRLKAWQTFPVTADTPLSEAVRTKTSLFISSPEKFAARYPYLVKEHPNASHATAAVPLIVEERVLGALAVSYKEAQEFDSTNRAFILAMAQQCAQALDRARLYEVERQARLEAEANQQRLSLLAEMRERNRLAQELHDTVAQALGYLNLKISLTYNLLLNNQVEEAKANFQELKQVIGESYTDVREEIFNLRAKILSGLSFMELLERYVDKYRRFYKLEIHLIQEAEVNLFDFPPEVSSQLIRTIQEALINIRKHAQVSTAIIRLGQEDGFIRISIEDQGRGFNRSQTASKLSSFGLQIMRERVESVDGSLEINTVPGQGTQIILRYKK
jgi:PAS domain S-box-containing protein